MQDAGIKLTSVASALLTKSGRAILEALLAGQDDPDALAELARGRLRAKVPALREALAGRFRVGHHGLLVAQMLAHIDFLDAAIADLDATLELAAAPFQAVLKRMCTIPGVSIRTAIMLLAECASRAAHTGADGSCTGHNEPVDHAIGRCRGDITTVDGQGRPLSVVLTGGNINLTTMFEQGPGGRGVPPARPVGAR
jgi:transposase